jgi:hypothetical protein
MAGRIRGLAVDLVAPLLFIIAPKPFKPLWNKRKRLWHVKTA